MLTTSEEVPGSNRNSGLGVNIPPSSSLKEDEVMIYTCLQQTPVAAFLSRI